MRKEEVESNFPLAVLCGFLTAILLTGLWAYITYLTNFQIGWMAVGVGCVIGFVVRYTGKGYTQSFGILAAVLSLLSCIAGNMFFILLCISKNDNIPLLELFQNVDYSSLLGVLAKDSKPVDLLFYVLAMYEGYKLSLIPLEEPQTIPV